MNDDPDETLSRGSFMAAQAPLRAPLQLKYRATKTEDVVRTYTLTVPWATLRRLFQQTKDGPGGDHRSPTYVPGTRLLWRNGDKSVLLTCFVVERIQSLSS